MTATIDRTGCDSRYHGTRRAYRQNGCRCADTVEAHNRHRAQLGKGPVQDQCAPALGSRRRIQALVAIGYTYQAIADAAELRRNTIYEIATDRVNQVRPETATKIGAAFDALSGTPGGRRESVRYARKLGWAPPGMWCDIDDPNEEMDCTEDPDLVDELLVYLFIKGEKPAYELNDAERREAAQQLLAKGKTANQIALQLHVTLKKAREVLAA